MLQKSDIHYLAASLEIVAEDDKKRHNRLHNLLTEFKGLLEEYSRLKSAYEEVREEREKYKKQARTQERNPFVLVLIDGDGYLFKEDHIKTGVEGGLHAARQLSDSIRALMHETTGIWAEHCRIMVRVYANVFGLSKVLAQVGMVKNEPCSLWPFTSAFTRAQDLFDFVDAAGKKEGSDYKIREMFRLFADSEQCQHIYFAGCHDAGYGSMLTPYIGRSDRITLIKAASFHRDFENLGLPIKELPSVFMATPLIPQISQFSTDNRPFMTTPASIRPKKRIKPSQQVDIRGTSPHPSRSSSPSPTRIELPRSCIMSKKYIPLNKAGMRLDFYCPHPSEQAFEEYHLRASQHKVCNSYHLSGQCEREDCPFDHGDISGTVVEVLKFIMLQYPCSQSSACRSIKCYFGHICQRPGCTGLENPRCRLSPLAHTADLRVMEWVVPIEQTELESPNAARVRSNTSASTLT